MVKQPPDYYGDLKSSVTADSVYLLRKIEFIGFFCVSVILFDIHFPLFKYFFCIFSPSKCFPFLLQMIVTSPWAPPIH